MKGSPAFLFYVDRFLGGTLGMALAQKGAYITLLCLQFNKGFLELDDIENVIGRDFDTVWPKIKGKFEEIEPGIFQNQFMHETREERLRLSKTRSEIGKTGGRPKSEKEAKEKQIPKQKKTNSFVLGDSNSNSNNLNSMDETLGESKVIPMNDDTRLSLSANSAKNSEAAKIEKEFRQLFDVNFEQKGNPASARAALVQAAEQIKQAERLPLGLACEKIVEQAAKWRVCMMLDGTAKKYWPNCETWLNEGHWQKDFEALAASIRQEKAGIQQKPLDAAFNQAGAQIL